MMPTRTALAALFVALAAPAVADGSPALMTSVKWAHADSDAVWFLIAPDGTVTGHGGCNRLRGTATLSDGAIAFGRLVSTKMACADLDAMARESALFAVLTGTVPADVVDGILTLTPASGDPLRFYAEVPEPAKP